MRLGRLAASQYHAVGSNTYDAVAIQGTVVSLALSLVVSTTEYRHTGLTQYVYY